MASDNGIFTATFDIDHIAINEIYNQIKEKNILPLILDLGNPSRTWVGIIVRGNLSKTKGLPDATMAPALIDHMVISNNMPFAKVAAFFSELSPYHIINLFQKRIIGIF